MRGMSVHDESRGENYTAPVERAIPAELAGLRLDQALARLFPEHSRSRLQAWVRAGRVTVDAGRADVKRKVWGGERVALSAVQPVAEGGHAPQAIELRIVHEDDAILVVDKPAGLVVHPGAGNRDGTLANALLHHASALVGVPRAGIVHRLDKDTTGLLVVAKTLPAQTELVRQLAARTVKREYLALVHGRVAGAGEVDAPIGRHPTARTRMAVTARGRPARTRYRVVDRFADATLLAVALDTGRTHQIRVHMRAIGHPIVGDPTYGKRAAPRDGRRTAPRDGERAARRDAGHSADPLAAFPRQALHAARLGLAHPASGATCEWQSDLPDDMRSLVDRLRERPRR
jgi:23S rRNA pseudouridine1911/1915/1917 synthase